MIETAAIGFFGPHGAVLVGVLLTALGLVAGIMAIIVILSAWEYRLRRRQEYEES